MAQEPASQGFRIYPLLYTSPRAVESELMRAFSSLPERPELVVDHRNGRILVRGPESAHQTTEQILGKLDRPYALVQNPIQNMVPDVPTAPAAPATTELKAYAAGPNVADVVGRLHQQYGHRGEVRIAADHRNSQVLVMAPPDVHTEVGRWLGPKPPSATPHDTQPLTAPAEPRPQFHQVHQARSGQPRPPVPPWHSEASVAQLAQVPAAVAKGSLPGAHVVSLRHIDFLSLHRSLEQMLRRPLPTTEDHASGTIRFSLEVAPGDRIAIQADHRTGQLVMTGRPALVASWARVIQALDRPNSPHATTSQLVSVKHSPPDKLRQALSALTLGGSPGAQAAHVVGVGNDRAAQRVAMLLQSRDGQPDERPTNPANGAAQPPAGQGTGAGLTAGGGLIGPVQIEVLEGTDQIIIIGHEKDVERVMQLIRELEQISQTTVPMVHVHPLRHTGSQAMAELVAQVYEQVYQARQGPVSITALGKPNALLLIGRNENVKTVVDLVNQLDQPVDPKSQFRIFQLRHAPAQQAKFTIDQFFNFDATGQQAVRPGLGTRLIVVADVRSNSLLVRASPRDMAEVEAMVRRLDTGTSAAVNELRVFVLKNTFAVELAVVLQRAISDQDTTRRGGTPGVPTPSAPPSPTPGGGAQGRTQRQQGLRSTALQLLTIDGEGKRRVSSGILSEVRITPDPRANALLVSAPAESMELIAALVKHLDQVPAAEAQIKVFTIINGDAQALAEMLSALFGQQAGGGQQAALVGTGGENALVQLRFSVDQRTNSIIAAGTMNDLAVVEAILLRLDESDPRRRKTKVYRLRNSPALDVALAVNEFLRSERQVEQAAPGVVSPFEQMEREVVVVAEPVSNSLIVSSTPRYIQEIEDLIKQLDQRPPMVMIQVLIAEVMLGDSEEFGVELGLQDSLLFDRSLLQNLLTTSTVTTTTTPGGAVTTVQEDVIQSADFTPGFNFNNNPPGNSGSDLSLATASTTAGQILSSFAVGRTNGELGYGGLVLSAGSENISVLLRALQENRRLDVLSRPQIMTLDNQQAFVQVGQVVPLISGVTLTDQGQTNNVIPTNVGLIMGVTPRISPDGLVVMQIDAEKSAVGPEEEGIPISISATGEVVRSPRIDTTRVQTTVSAMSGQTVVIGGLITKSTSNVHRRVPYIADLPIIGDLFRFDSVMERRTELLIIMTPHIIRNEEDAELIKQVESARMNWVLADVVELHGEAGLRSRSDHWDDDETTVIYPDLEDEGGAAPGLVPEGSETIDSSAPGYGAVLQRFDGGIQEVAYQSSGVDIVSMEQAEGQQVSRLPPVE